jgi:hypothetical protein
MKQAAEDAVIAITRIPTHRNDGSKIPRHELRAILNRVFDRFGGYSFEGPFEGAWLGDDGRRYQEKSHRLEVIIAPDEIQEARELFRSIGNQLGQRAIYFEVRDGGEIIQIE